MRQRLFVGIIAASLLIIAAIGIYDAGRRTQTTAAASAQPTAVAQGGGQSNGGNQGGQGGGQQKATDSATSTGTSEAGEPWQAAGTIVSLDDLGMNVTLDDGKQIYVELGPSTYWKAQNVPLAAGDKINIQGFFNGEQYHAGTVTKADGAKLVVRTEQGQPLWAGQSSSGGQGTGSETAVPPDAWVTLTGKVTGAGANGLPVNTAEKGDMVLSLGPANFWQTQGITFAIGDEVKILGFWQGTQFQVGEVQKVATGQRLMVRDPNGRPLWAGPGRNGKGGNGNGQSGNGTAHPTTTPAQ